MAFVRLFIGLDRYRSPLIDELDCARRDATALEALFADTLGGTSRLLLDKEATAAGIMAELEALADCGPEDTVVISFSGHGSDTHELVAHAMDAEGRAERLAALAMIKKWADRPRRCAGCRQRLRHVRLRERTAFHEGAPARHALRPRIGHRSTHHAPSRLCRKPAHPQAHRGGVRLKEDDRRHATANAARH